MMRYSIIASLCILICAGCTAQDNDSVDPDTRRDAVEALSTLEEARTPDVPDVSVEVEEIETPDVTVPPPEDDIPLIDDTPLPGDESPGYEEDAEEDTEDSVTEAGDEEDVTVATHADEEGESESIQGSVDEILAHLGDTVADVTSFSASFKEVEYDPIFSDETHSEGTIILVQEKDEATGEPYYKLRFTYTAPEQSVMVIRGGNVYLYAPGMTQPQVSTLEDEHVLDAYFSGFMSPERMRTHYYLERGDSTDERVTLHLTPKTATVAQLFRELRVTFCRETWLPVEIYQHRHNGRKIQYTFDSPEVNVVYDDVLFTREGAGRVE